MHAIQQVLGNSNGFGNSLEHNIILGRCLLCLRTMFANSTEAHNDNRFRRHGTYTFIIRKTKLVRPHCCIQLLMNYVISIFQVMSYLSLAAACSAASVTDLLHEAGRSHCPTKLCGRYQLSAAMAFLSWFLSLASCLFNFWILPSL